MGLRVSLTVCLLLVACSAFTSPSEDVNTREVMNFAFSEPLINGEKINEATQDLDQLQAQIDRLIIATDFYSAYDRLLVASDGVYLGNIYWLDYRLDGATRRAYAYIIYGNHDCAALIIPGSGHNQAHAIYNGTGYHGDIAEVMSSHCDTYILIKPNDGVRAIHDGKGKLDGDFVYNRLLMQGGSYGQSYLIEAMVIVKQLQSDYDKTIVMGLSQGGLAAFYVSLQASPDYAISASGFSLMQYKIHWSGHNQIVIPNLDNVYNLDAIKAIMADSPTRWLFTVGLAETGTLYEDAKTNITCDYLDTVGADVECVVHDGGHIFPIDVIERFL